MVIKVWQLAAALVLLLAGVPGAAYLITHGHGVALSYFVVVSATVWLCLHARRRVRRKKDLDDRPPAAQEAELGVAPGRTTAFWPAAVCVVGMALGAIAPWGHGPLGTTVSGLDGSNNGRILLGAAAIAGLCLLLHHMSAGRGSLTLMLLVGPIGGGVTLYDWQSVSSATRVGWGLHLGLVASVGLVIFVLALFARSGSRRTATSDTVEACPPVIHGSVGSVSAAIAEEPAQEQRLAPVTQQATIQRPVVYGGMTADLERLAALYASGALDEEEFRAAKARLLQAPAIATATREALLRTTGPYHG